MEYASLCEISVFRKSSVIHLRNVDAVKLYVEVVQSWFSACSRLSGVCVAKRYLYNVQIFLLVALLIPYLSLGRFTP